ncbi:MAG: putative phosphothreonine lyase domain-containing protein [Acidimicrobiales bacterium]
MSDQFQRMTSITVSVALRHDERMTMPSEIPSLSTSDYWIWAEDPSRAPGNPDTSGKWQVYVQREYVDEAWSTIASMVEQRQLGPAAKVSTVKENPNSPSGPGLHVIIVYASDWRDLNDLRRILRALHEVGLARGWLHFKRDLETRNGAYLNRGSRGVSVWNAAPGSDEISTKWVTGKRLVVTAENECEVISQIERQRSSG